MLIFYHYNTYISHAVCAQAYISCLQSLGHTVITSPTEAAMADIAILHDDPLNFPALFAAMPCLHAMFTIGYVVWETETLPEQYKKPLQLVDTLWTCSTFCRNSLRPHVRSVSIVPHIVTRTPVSQETLARVAQKIPRHDGFFFLSIVDAINPRKNITRLLQAFAFLRSQMSIPLHLILKQYRGVIDYSAIAGVHTIAEHLTNEEMSALHIHSDAYISTHCSEGWGLGLSEAMAFGKPVIGTGYSGNMDFMNKSNSFPISYRLEPVSDQMCKLLPLFTKSMVWAQIETTELLTTMRNIIEGRYDKAICHHASDITQSFSPRVVGRLISDLFEQYAAHQLLPKHI